MKNVISYSLFGDKPLYLNGAIANVQLAKSIYPGWVCRFYIDDTVPERVTTTLKAEGAEVIVKPRNTEMSGMTWRFEPAYDPDVKYFIVRDIDDRLSRRESVAVDEWIASGKSFHVLRDHPNHRYPVMGGMWGGISGAIPEFKKILEQYASWHGLGFWWDMQFLGECLWDGFIKNDHIAHDEYWRPTGTERKYTVPLDNVRSFIGNKYDAEGNPVYDLIKDSTLGTSYFLCNHLGLGDHIICNGLTRVVSEGKNLYIFAKHHNAQSVMFMFRDLPNVHVISVHSDEDVKTIIAPYPGSCKIVTGVYKDGFWDIPNKSFDEVFYIQAGVPFNTRWDRFFIQRDLDEERRVIDTLLKGPYVFVHDDPSRGFSITGHLPEGLQVIRPTPGLTTIFGYIGLIDRAEEAHFIDSSFMFMVDSLPGIGKNLTIHRYSRISHMDKFSTPVLKRDWRIIL